MSLAIRGLGTALPTNRLPQMELAEAAKQFCAEDDEQRQMLGSLYRHTEIETRHVVFQAEKVRSVMKGGTADSVFVPQGKEDRGPGTGSAAVTYADGKLYFRYQNGVMALIDATPARYHLVSKFQLPEDSGKLNHALNKGQPLVRAAPHAGITRRFGKLAYQLNGQSAK